MNMGKYKELVVLKGLLREQKITYKILASYLKKTISAVSNKINGKSVFDLLEVSKIAELTNMGKEEIPRYFF